MKNSVRLSVKPGDLVQPRRMNLTLEVFDTPSEMGSPICRWRRGELGIVLGGTEDEGEEMVQVLVGGRVGWVDMWCLTVFNTRD